jgi:type I restriction enzyme R subunit
VAAIAHEDRIVRAQVDRNTREQALKGNLEGVIQDAIMRSETSYKDMTEHLMDRDRQAFNMFMNVVYDIMKSGQHIDLNNLS